MSAQPPHDIEGVSIMTQLSEDRESYETLLEREFRIMVWNKARDQGLNDRDAMRRIEEEVAALKAKAA
jgi:hypothetical protein